MQEVSSGLARRELPQLSPGPRDTAVFQLENPHGLGTCIGDELGLWPDMIVMHERILGIPFQAVFHPGAKIKSGQLLSPLPSVFRDEPGEWMARNGEDPIETVGMNNLLENTPVKMLRRADKSAEPRRAHSTDRHLNPPIHRLREVKESTPACFGNVEEEAAGVFLEKDWHQH